MDPEIAIRYSDKVLDEVAKRYGIQAEGLTLLDGFESYIFEFSRSEGDYILRLGHNIRRRKNHILGEVAWINYLAGRGASVAKAVASDCGELVEFIDDQKGGAFMATAFMKAPGHPPSESQWNSQLFESWGRLLGRIHALSKDYVPADPSLKRYGWDSAENIKVIEWLSPNDLVVQRKFRELMEYLQSLEKNKDGYGMIHQDAHAGNFFVDQEYKITLFDFDDCVYGWYIYDIAMVFFYALMGHEKDKRYLRAFTTTFMKGYYQENDIDSCWLKEIPYFLKLREIDLYAQINFAFGGFEKVDDPWCRKYLAGRKRRIVEGVPFVDFNWVSLTKQQER